MTPQISARFRALLSSERPARANTILHRRLAGR